MSGTKKLSRIHEKPRWWHKEVIFLEAGEVVLYCDVHYNWSGEFDLLATIIGPPCYLTEVGFNYVEPVQLPIIYLPVISCGTAMQI